jgi:ornithine cyclodeaminase
MRVLNAADVRRLLSMQQCIEIMESAMRAVSAGSVSIPPRTFVPLTNPDDHLGLMPGSAPGLPAYGAKIISLHRGNAARQLPAIQGFVALFDSDTGTPVAIIDGASVTAIRTAAASGLATRVLAREDASSHGILGTGVQAKTHVEAIASVRETDLVRVWGRDRKKAQRFAADQSRRLGLDVVAVESAAEAVSCDVVSSVTGASEPVLEGAWLSPGSHVNLVGAHTPETREADSEALARATIYVDLLASAQAEAGDILIPVAQGRLRWGDVAGEIGQVLTGAVAGRDSDSQITLYKSLGIYAQDLFVANYLLDQASAADVGTRVELS